MFHFGVDYYPEHWPEERWAIDAQNMQAAGFNTVRLAEFAWSRMEPRPDSFDFAWLDRAIAVLHAHGIHVILGTPTASPPPWVMAMYPDAYLVRENGVAATYGNRREYCPSHPGYRARSRRITAAMAEHYADHPAVVGWQTDNEFGDRCYCAACQASFRAWLMRRYGSLDALNAAWGTVFWSHEYSEWSQIPAPLATAGHFTYGSPNPGLGLDYLRFVSDTYVDFQHEQVDILRRLCPQHFITHNLMGFRYDLLNYYELAADLDFVTWDNYRRVQWNMVAEVDTADAALSHATMRGLKQRNFWVMEQQAGPGGWEIVSVAPRPGELRLWAWQAIAHGADGIIFFRWRTARFGTEEYWHGLLDHDGTLSRRYHEIKGMGGEIQRSGEQIAGSEVRAEVAMLLSYDSRFAFQIQANNPAFTYTAHFRDVYRAFYGRNVAVDVLPPDAELGDYRLVIAPALHVLPDSAAANLSAYVQNGGVLMLTARSAVKDEANAVVDLPLPGLLAELCGVRVEEYDSPPPGVTQPLALNLPGAPAARTAHTVAWCDVLAPTSAEVVATYTQEYYAGKPAVTRNRAGRGQAIYVGTFGDAALYDALADWLIAEAGIAAGNASPAGVEICTRRHAERTLVFVLNHTRAVQQVTLPGDFSLLAGAALPSDGVLEIGPLEVIVLLAEPA